MAAGQSVPKGDEGFARVLLVTELQLNRLQADTARTARRRAAADMVLEQLARAQLSRWLPEESISPRQWQALKAGAAEAAALWERLLPHLALSQRQMSEYRRLCRVDAALPEEKRVAGRWLWEQLCDRVQLDFRKALEALPEEERCVSPSTWRRFITAAACTNEDSARGIARAVAMDEEATERLCGTLLRDVFPDDRPLRAPVRARVKAEGLSFQQFWARTTLSKGAVERFQGPAEAAKEARPITQRVLLQLAVALQAESEEAEAFLALVGSGFYWPQDLVVLAAIRGKIFWLGDISELLRVYRLKDIYR